MIIHGDGDGMVAIDGDRILVSMNDIWDLDQIVSSVGLMNPLLWTTYIPLSYDFVSRLMGVGLELRKVTEEAGCLCGSGCPGYRFYHPQLLSLINNPQPGLTVRREWSSINRMNHHEIATAWKKGRSI